MTEPQYGEPGYCDHDDCSCVLEPFDVQAQLKEATRAIQGIIQTLAKF